MEISISCMSFDTDACFIINAKGKGGHTSGGGIDAGSGGGAFVGNFALSASGKGGGFKTAVYGTFFLFT